jgi:hypothetical protein
LALFGPSWQQGSPAKRPAEQVSHGLPCLAALEPAMPAPADCNPLSSRSGRRPQAGGTRYFRLANSVVIRLLPLPKFVDPAKNSVDPQSNEFVV